jgi:hypothetical protein
MKDNIDNKHIGNRKFIIELRYAPIVSMLDKRGQITDAIVKSKCFATFHWEVNPGEVTIRDHAEKKESKNIVFVSFNRFSFISYKVDSIESFYSNFKKAYEAVSEVLGEIIIQRIGCRILGTYKVKSQDFSSILNHFKEAFPSKIFIEKYPTKDLSFTLNYENGMYRVGPVNVDDSFYDEEFNMGESERHVGIAIDTDNYLTNTIKDISDKSLIKDVYTLSLAVEKELYSNLAEY